MCMLVLSTVYNLYTNSEDLEEMRYMYNQIIVFLNFDLEFEIFNSAR